MQVPRVRVVAQTVEIPQSLFVEKTVMIPKIQTVQGPRISESLSGEITVAVKMDHEIVVQESRHDCGRPFHVVSTSGSMHQQHTPGQAEEEREKKETGEGGQSEEGEKGREERASVRKGERGKEEGGDSEE